jgi:hypothetical protein
MEWGSTEACAWDDERTRRVLCPSAAERALRLLIPTDHECVRVHVRSNLPWFVGHELSMIFLGRLPLLIIIPLLIITRVCMTQISAQW